MQKIIELTSKDFLSGLAISSHMPTGVFHEASGINPFRDPFTSSDNVGLLQTSQAAQNIAGGVVVDAVRGSVYLGSSFRGYFWGNAGHLYEVDTDSFPTPTDLRTVSNPADGLAIYQPPTGSKKLLYWQTTQFGTWDFAASYNDGAYTGLQSTIIHPTHPFVGNVYYGNKDRIGEVSNDGVGNIVHTLNVLDFPSDLLVTTINDDGYYLIVGATTNTISGNLKIHTLNKIFFWDTVSSSWNKEYEIPTAYIASIQKLGNLMYALCADGLYAFSFSIPPTLVVPFSNNDAPSTVGGVAPTHQVACVKDGVLYWTSVGTDICAYGSPIPGLSPRFFKPFKAFSGGVPTHLSVAGKFKLVTADENEFGYVDFQNGGNTSLVAETIYIPLERKWNIMKMEIILGEPMASGDSLNIDVKSDEDTSATDWGTMSFAADGAVRTKLMVSSGATNYIAENLKLIFNFNGGNVKIKKVMVYGDPMTI